MRRERFHRPPTQQGRPRPSRELSRRALGLVLAAGFFALLASAIPRSGAAQKPLRLFVFVTTDVRARALEQEITAALPGIQVRVFGRVRELQSAVTEEAPDAVLARPVVLEALGLRPVVRGSRRGSTAERYVLLGIGRSYKPSEVGDQALGAVDLVGRNEMKAFVSRVLGVTAPKLKLVTTEHDLLPLLQFGEVAAVLAAEKWVGVLEKKSNLDLRATVLENGVELPALSCASESVRANVERRIKAWPTALNVRFGVDEWK